MHCIESLCFIYFLTSRVHMIATLNHFVQFQRDYWVNELDIVKDRFQKSEKKLRSVIQKTLFGYSCIFLGLSILNDVIFAYYKRPMILLILRQAIELSGYIVLLQTYMHVTIRAYFEMKYRHHDTFLRHKNSRRVLFITTTLGFMVKIIFKCIFSYSRICI